MSTLQPGLETSHQSAIGRAPQSARATLRRPRWALAVKRLVDIVGSGLGLVLFAPLLAGLAVAVKLQDGGPILYRRRVIGSGGPFDALKFRSMCSDADTVLDNSPSLRARFQANFKLKSDPRITPLGARLRKHSLDELPQLLNVLLGQMSLVGPRMITASELEKYGEFQDLLLSVKPGLTGYWQVNGRQEIDYQGRVAMDVYYLQHWNLRLDLLILLQTPWKVLKGEGAL